MIARLTLTSCEALETSQRSRRGVRHPLRRSSLLAPAIGALGGCSAGSAPALILFGAYFPDWLVFAILTVLCAVVTRVIIGLVGHAESLPYPLFTCLAVGVLIAGIVGFLWLGL